MCVCESGGSYHDKLHITEDADAEVGGVQRGGGVVELRVAAAHRHGVHSLRAAQRRRPVQTTQMGRAAEL